MFSSNSNLLWMYSPKRITRTAKGIMRIWLKQMPSHDSSVSGEAKKDLIRKRGELGLNTRGYEKWSYSLILFELKCSARKTRFITRTDYDEDGQVLDTEEESGDWQEVFPESVAERMLKVGCKQRK